MRYKGMLSLKSILKRSVYYAVHKDEVPELKYEMDVYAEEYDGSMSLLEYNFTQSEEIKMWYYDPIQSRAKELVDYYCHEDEKYINGEWVPPYKTMTVFVWKLSGMDTEKPKRKKIAMIKLDAKDGTIINEWKDKKEM